MLAAVDVGVADLRACGLGRGDDARTGRDRIAGATAADFGVLRGGDRHAETERRESGRNLEHVFHTRPCRPHGHSSP
jgi:hypothetical protein